MLIRYNYRRGMQSNLLQVICQVQILFLVGVKTHLV